MFIVTNRELQENEPPERRFGNELNETHHFEVRVAEAKKVNKKWQVEVFPDLMPHEGGEVHASEVIFLREQAKMKEKKRDCLFFVHGFCTNFEDALETGYALEKKYDVDVLMFSWPTHKDDGDSWEDQPEGMLKYRPDKIRAEASKTALEKCLRKLQGYLNKYSKLACNQSFNFACYSMGNYLLEELVRSSLYSDETSFFDNICLLAADVNNKGHEEWVDRLAYRKRLYVVINENDIALFASRAKFGKQQLARLGHWVRNLAAKNAFYIDVTDQAGISHDYFNDKKLLKQAPLKKLFADMFHGRRAERGLNFKPALGTYELPD
ncbi:MAG: alpha/beta hydrolase [Cyanobacteria bacterium P01_D01_bin.73]